jgi:hypothetical protein
MRGPGVAAAALVLLTGASVYDGGKTAAPPPSDLELERARTTALEAQMNYLVGVERRLEFEVRKYQDAAQQNLLKPDETAKWWGDYAKAKLPPEAKQ